MLNQYSTEASVHIFCITQYNKKKLLKKNLMKNVYKKKICKKYIKIQDYIDAIKI